MKTTQLRALLSSAGGTIFAVTFVKKDGTQRVMNARLGVTKHLRGGVSTTAHKKNLMTVFDCQKGQYRCINLDTVTAVKVGGVEYRVGGES